MEENVMSRIGARCRWPMLLCGMLAAAGWAAGGDEPLFGNIQITVSQQAGESTRRALIVCGHPGDDEHRKQFAETVDSLRASLIDRLQFDAESVWVLFGGEEVSADAPRPKTVRGPSTQDSIAATIDRLKHALRPEDSLWVIVIGHSYYDRRHSWFNIPGPDFNEESFGKSFEGLACREQVFWITTPVSGFYIKPLAAHGRIVITATEADREINETTFPHQLAKLLSAPPDRDELDVDKTGTISLFDLYVTLARRIAQSYADQMQVATEHAHLDDNGDGRGTEIQRDYLSEELGGRGNSETPLLRNPTADGHLSAQIVISTEDSFFQFQK
jgi:hypothetical protein